MYIPFISTSARHSCRSTRRRARSESKVTTCTSHTGDPSVYRNFSGLTRRKGGGGKGRGPTSSGKGTGSGSKGNGGKSLGKPSKVSLGGGRLPNSKKSATSYGAGGGRAVPIPPGMPFSGRIAGGGNRQGVYGNSIYGSGYPGVSAPYSVSGRGFPYYFWPVVWNDHSTEYGLPDNTSRPGGPLDVAWFHSKNTSSTFLVLADKSTVSSLIGSVKANCSSYLSSDNMSSSPTPYTNQSSVPRFEQAIQYYRASSVVLAFAGNDSGTQNDTQNSNASMVPAVSLPNGTDTKLLTCLNDTIGRAVPLIDAGIRTGPPAIYTLLLTWLLAEAFRSTF